MGQCMQDGGVLVKGQASDVHVPIMGLCDLGNGLHKARWSVQQYYAGVARMLLLRNGCKGRSDLHVAASGTCCCLLGILGRISSCAVSTTATVSVKHPWLLAEKWCSCCTTARCSDGQPREQLACSTLEQGRCDRLRAMSWYWHDHTAAAAGNITACSTASQDSPHSPGLPPEHASAGRFCAPPEAP